MFIRVKTTPNSPRRSVQLVESVRSGGKVRQRIVRHVGIAMDDDELVRLKELGEFIKAKISDERQPGLFPPEPIAEQAIRASRAANKALRVDLKQLEEEQRVVTGIHEVYGATYRQLGFDKLLPRSRYRASHDSLLHTVMARIANPDSKRGSVRRLEQDFGVGLPLEKLYRMMDHLAGRVIERLKTRVGSATQALLPEPLNVLFFDCTTLYFESFTEDELKQNGFSKDAKHHQVQVLLALMVTREGLPVSYAVFPGATYEGHSFIPVLKDVQQRHPLGQAVWVADRGMFSDDNLKELEAQGCGYIVGARIKNLPKTLAEQILDTGAYRPLEGVAGMQVAQWRHGDRRLVVTYNPARARKDQHERRKAVEKLIKKLGKSDNPKALLGHRGNQRFITIDGDARLMLNEAKVKEAARWDGLQGIITNLEDMPHHELLSRYRGLWQVEESFRITKHDLKVRPIYHWTPHRVQAHIAIAFMAFACIRHLAYRVALQKRRMSPEVIRNALVHRQCSVLRHRRTGKRYAVPSKPSRETEDIYRAMGLPLPTTPCELT